MTLQSLKASILEAPALRLRPSRPGQERLPDGEVRLATEADAQVIARWISGVDRGFLGAAPNRDMAGVVVDWLQEGVAAFVLELVGASGTRELAAFINVAPVAGTQAGCEIGRLVVRPDLRRRGIGTSLLKKLVAAAGGGQGSDMILVRAHRENRNALALFHEARLQEVPSLQTSWAEPERYVWFRWNPSPSLALFGSVIRRHRTEFRWSQEELAFRLGASRSTVNMLERGQRWVSKEMLHELIRQFRLDEFGTVELLLALVGSRPDEVFRAIQQFSEKTQDQADLWLFVDEIAEASIPAFYKTSVEAMRNGHRRWYFVSDDVWKRDGRDLVRKFVTDVGEDQLRRVLRVYEAPYPFPLLRLVFRNPTNIDAESVTIEGPNGVRVPVSERLRQPLVLFIQKVVVGIEDGLQRRRDIAGEHPGFRRLYPPKEANYG